MKRGISKYRIALILFANVAHAATLNDNDWNGSKNRKLKKYKSIYDEGKFLEFLLCAA